MEHGLLPTVVVGGLGGSGTRAVAALLHAGGLHLGTDLNEALDNLWVTLLFKHPRLTETSSTTIDDRLALLAKATLGLAGLTRKERAELDELTCVDRPQHARAWLCERAASLEAACTRPVGNVAWGWKEPNTHMLLPHLERWGVRYIHVVRDGLYMARSRNRNQHAYWPRALGCPAPEPTPAYALKFWCAVQRRAERFQHRMGSRFLMLDYDALCADPLEGIAAMNNFLAETTVVIPAAAANELTPPKAASEDRPTDLDQQDIEFALAKRARCG